MDLSVSAPAIDEVRHVERIRGGEHQLAARIEVTSHAGQKAPDVIEMFDELAGEDSIELPAEIEIAGIGQPDVEALPLEFFDGVLVDVDTDQVGELLGEETVQPVGSPIARGTTQIQH